MLFNSFEFLIFFIIVYTCYLISQHKKQNIILLIASYWFYAAWDWRFLSLIWISTLVDYYCGLKIFQSPQPKEQKKFLALSIITNLSLLGFFKYFDFFLENFSSMLGVLHISVPMSTLKIVLPVGISFYTFQTMSYTIDIYHKRLKPTHNLLDFALFVAFFPQLVAGPIERARNLLPQVQKARTITLPKIYEGSYLIFWGLFQKVFVADNLAKIVDPIFAQTSFTSSFQILVGLYAFAFQIFCDFAGYSNIARGLCKCMGFEIMINFNLPYFAKNPSEFWQRWHISLSSWIRDYLYIPLGGNRKGAKKTLQNLLVTMILGGLWHGAAWTFIFWGAFHGGILILYQLKESYLDPILEKKYRFAPKSWAARAFDVLQVLIFFHIVCIGWLIFRAQSLTQFLIMLKTLLFGWGPISAYGSIFLEVLGFSAILIIVQNVQHWKKDLMIMYKLDWPLRSVYYYVLLILLIIFGVTDAQDFIYFQF